MGILSPRTVWRAIAVLLLLVLFAAFALWLLRPRFSESEIRSRVISSIQAEAAQSFYVTGQLDLVANSTVEDTRYLLPPIRLNLGTTSATVRLPGIVAYGFDVRQLHSDHISAKPDGEVVVSLPELSVFSVEPRLELMEIQTDVGWARTYSGSGQEVTREAMRQAQDILRQQAVVYLRDNAQPRINTANALEAMLRPVLKSAGIREPRFVFQIGENLVLQPEG